MVVLVPKMQTDTYRMATASNSRVWQTIPLLIAICFVSLPTYAKYSDGTGGPNYPYHGAMAEEMVFRQNGLN